MAKETNKIEFVYFVMLDETSRDVIAAIYCIQYPRFKARLEVKTHP